MSIIIVDESFRAVMSMALNAYYATGPIAVIWIASLLEFQYQKPSWKKYICNLMILSVPAANLQLFLWLWKWAAVISGGHINVSGSGFWNDGYILPLLIRRSAYTRDGDLYSIFAFYKNLKNPPTISIFRTVTYGWKFILVNLGFKQKQL